MNRILKRPMFRMGGSSGTGITSGLDKPRVKYSEGTTRERLLSAIGQAPSPLPQFLTQFGLNLLSQSPRGNIFATAATAAQKPTQDLFKDIEKQRALEAQVGLTAEKLDIAQEQALALKRAERLGTKILTKDEVKKNFPELPDNTIVQQKADGTFKFDKPDAASVKKSADLKSTIGLLNKIETNYEDLGKPVGGLAGFGFDPDRIKGQVGRITGSEKGIKYANLVADIDKTTTFLTQAISGAAVSEQEAKRIRALIPQLDDTEVVFEAKLKSLRSYLGDAVKNYGGDVEALMKDGVTAKDYLPTRSKKLEDMTDEELQILKDELQIELQQGS
jgi:hypothetical protein